MLSISWIYYAVGIIVAFTGVTLLLLRKKFSNKLSVLLFIAFFVWLGIFSGFIQQKLQTSEIITITALDETGSIGDGIGTTVALKGIAYDGDVQKVLIKSGGWAYDESHGYFFWVPEGSEFHQKDMIQSITFEAQISKSRKLVFSGGSWCGKVSIQYGDTVLTADTSSKEDFAPIMVSAPSDQTVLNSTNLTNILCFAAIYFILTGVSIGIIYFVLRTNKLNKFRNYRFLFGELVKRDFTLKYKRTILGILWSILSPLMNLLIMWLVFNKILGSNVDHFVIYLFAGQLVFSYFSDATNLGMSSLLDNAGIFTKVNVPKYMFLLSRNVSSMINFGITLLIFFLFVVFEGLPFSWNYLMLLYPIICMIVFNVGVGLILSALYVFFRDMQYLWAIFTQLLMWTSAIFYSISNFNQTAQNIFLINPIYVFIRYFRKIVIEATVPTVSFHLLATAYALLALGIGSWLYKKYNHEFLYYI